MSDNENAENVKGDQNTAVIAGSNGNGSGAEDVTGLKNALAAERESAKTATKELRALQARLQTLEDKEKTDLERITGERDTLKADYDKTIGELRAERAERLVTSAASKANAIRPDAIYRLVSSDLVYGDDGRPSNTDAVMTQAKKDFPELFRAGAGSGDGGRGNGELPKDGNAAMNQMIRQAAGRSG